MILVMLVGMALVDGPTTPLVGTVVARDGAPIVGAELVLTSPTPGESPVVARGKSGEGGKFRFDRPAGLAPTNSVLMPTLWASAPGHRMAVIRFPKNVPRSDEPVRVVLGPPARTEILVETPDGAPLAGARVNIQLTKSEPLPLPDPMADLSERTTGADGVAVLDSFGPEEVVSVDVIAKGFGTQPRRFDPPRPESRRVRLLPVVSLMGKLVPDQDQPRLAKGWRVRAWTRQRRNDSQVDTMAGYGETTTDDEGRFALPEIAPGSLRLVVIPPGDPDLLADFPLPLAVHEDRENVLVIPLRKPSILTGLILEHGTGNPIVGMEVILFRPNNSGSVRVKTNDQGRYTFRSLAGKASVWGPEVPPGYVTSPGLNRHGVEVPEASVPVDLGTTELLRAAPPLKGEVRDESGKPVAGVVVRGQWNSSTPLGNASGSGNYTTDDQGRFELKGLAPGARVRLTAGLQDRETAAPVVAVAGDDKPVTISLIPRRLLPSPRLNGMSPEQRAKDAKRTAMLQTILAQQKPRPAVVPRGAQARIMVDNGVSVMLNLVQDRPALPPPESEHDDIDEDEVARRQPDPLAIVRINQQWVVPEEAFDQFLFEGSPNAEVGRALLDAMLDAEIETAAKTHRLTATQRAKLKLAGRGDIKRLLDRAEKGRQAFQRTRNDMNECIQGLRQLVPLRVEIKEGPFFAGSLYSKTLSKMIVEEPRGGR